MYSVPRRDTGVQLFCPALLSGTPGTLSQDASPKPRRLRDRMPPNQSSNTPVVIDARNARGSDRTSCDSSLVTHLLAPGPMGRRISAPVCSLPCSAMLATCTRCLLRLVRASAGGRLAVPFGCRHRIRAPFSEARGEEARAPAVGVCPPAEDRVPELTRGYGARPMCRISPAPCAMLVRKLPVAQAPAFARSRLSGGASPRSTGAPEGPGKAVIV